MKIATYNIWDDERDFDIRLKLLVKELNKYEIDILAMQEVKNQEVFDYIKIETGYQFGYYFEGLGFLSNIEIKLQKTYSEENNYILRVSAGEVGFTTLHLDWKEQHIRIKGLDAYFDILEEDCLDAEFLLGDFNDVPEDKIHFELIMSEFIDLHQSYAHSINEIPLPTLDMVNNPRWRNQETDEEPCRFDWVMLNTINKFEIKSVFLIGTDEENEVTPSDHYGVLVDIEI